MDAIVNVTPDWGIGFENRLLVAIPEDLRRFRALTEGKTVILGRKTLQTFPGGRPLKNRRNIVLSSDPDFHPEGAETVRSEKELLSLLRTLDKEQLCVIGGESVYRMLLPYCEGVRLTRTYRDLPADRFFPNLDALPGWEISAASERLEAEGTEYQFIDYVNKFPLPL